ncbi:MAG TPA: hypothetical protein VE988_15380 [Gemmataceae bacterium]|nr:hypothetical protein [Gemmataceae bacterium]
MKAKRLALLALVAAAAFVWLWHSRDAAEAQNIEATLKTLPKFYNVRDYRAEPYIRAARALQDMGQEKACEELRKLAKTYQFEDQVFILCRMLFTAKANQEFRSPALGQPHFLDGTKFTDWPLTPITIVDGVPFLIVYGYSLNGKPERADGYLEDCIKNCDWNRTQFQMLNQQVKLNALKKLLAAREEKGGLGEGDAVWLANQITK